MTTRLDVLKTYKLYIDGKFPRTESGRTMIVEAGKGKVFAHLCKASRKDLREAVEAARKAQTGWANATAYLRGQILYRMAEMLEGKKRELIEAIEAVGAVATKKSKGAKAMGAEAEVLASIDRLVCFAGWADKYAQVLGCNNPVSGPFYNFTSPEATGVVAAIAPDEAPLLAFVSLVAPALCAGNAVVALASEANPVPAAVFAEACATGDVPGGVLNILTGLRSELLPVIAAHRDIDAIHAANMTVEETTTLKQGAAENIKRVVVRSVPDWMDTADAHSPWRIEPLIDFKTMWHPASA
ncbi:MAG: aldehyde dehydrogenase family protein [Phycisphaerae bacterium]|nr:aldehyde dehydrogenase family protein [Phycisphaerae bacterium]MBN8597628.1 aldehyde dehydrogenase family protein [Planctomycetota bacterium]